MRARAAAFVAAPVFIGALVPLAGAGATEHQTFTVLVGAELNDSGGTQLGTRFYPETLTVAPGDVIRFRTGGLHGVTLLPSSVEDAGAWVAANAPARDGEWSLFQSDPDEKGLKLNPGVIRATESSCSNPFVPPSAGTPCVFDASDEHGVLHSGLPVWGTPLDFSVNVTAPVGESFVVQDLVDTDMRMTVTVAESAPSTPDAVSAEASDLIATDATEAADLHTEWSAKPATKTVKKGVTTWTAFAGVESDNVTLNAFYPQKLTIKKAHKVKWSFEELLNSSHTVTFPGSYATAAYEVVCDTDGDAGTAADQPKASENPMAPCENADEIEFDLPKQLTKKFSDGKWNNGSKELDSSGARGATGLAASAKPWTLSFPVKSGKKPFTYRSLTAPNMTAKVTVKA